MGVGKSTVAKELSKKLDYKLIDTDDEIVAREGRSISDIFRKKGEEYFRSLERELIEKLSADDNLIVSCGGGIIKSDDNIDNMKKSGLVILLDASPEVIYMRVKDDNTRPLLRKNPGINGIKKLLEERRPLYNKAFTHRVDANRSEKKVAEDIIGILNNI